jgi:hypothetical protein
LVMTVLQSAGGLFAVGVFAVVAGFAAVAVAAAGLGCGGHTPITVITAASAGTEAEVSTGAWAGCGGGGALGAACPQASVPNKTHISQLLPITDFLQDWSIRKLKVPSIKS